MATPQIAPPAGFELDAPKTATLPGGFVLDAPTNQPPEGFVLDAPKQKTPQEHAADPSFDPVEHYRKNPSKETLDTAIAVHELQSKQPTDYGKAIGDFAKGAIPAVATGIYGFAKGVVNAAGNVWTAATGNEDESDRAKRELAAAAQLGSLQGFVNMPTGIGRNVGRLFGKTDRTLSPQERAERIQYDAARRDIEEQLASGTLEPGSNPLLQHVEEKTKTPEQLAAAGKPIDPERVQGQAFIGDPTTYLLPGAAELTAPIIGKAITAPLLKTAGKIIGATGKAGATILGHGRSTLGGLGAAIYYHNPLAAVAGFSAEQAAKNVAPKVASMLSEAGAEAAGQAFPPLGQNIATKAFKAGATGAVTGGALAVPFMAAAQTPEEAGSAFGGGIGIGGVLGGLGGVKGSRQIETAAKFGQLAKEGATMRYNLGWDDAAQRGLASLPQETQNLVNAYKARFNGMADKDGLPIGQIYPLTKADYEQATNHYAGGEGKNSPGFITSDGRMIFLNAEHGAGALAHETGHLTEFLHDIARAHDQASLQDAIRPLIRDASGAPTRDFQNFIDGYNAKAAKKGIDMRKVAANDPLYYDKEFAAEHARKILEGENIAGFNLPKPLTERMTQAAGSWLRSQGILPKQGGAMEFGGSEIKAITSQMRDILYKQGEQSEALRSARAEGKTVEPTVARRLSELEAILKQPAPTATSSVDEAKAYRAAENEYAALKKIIASQPAYPASGAPPTPPSAPQAPQAPISHVATKAASEASADARAALVNLKEKPGDVNRILIEANKQHGSPITSATNLITAFYRLKNGGTVKSGEFSGAPKPVTAPAAPITLSPEIGRPFRDSEGNDRTVTGTSSNPAHVGDIVWTKDGTVRKVAKQPAGGTIDTVRPQDATGQGQTYKDGEYVVLTHDIVAPKTTPKSLEIKAGANGTFDIVNEKGEVVSGGLADQTAANRALSQLKAGNKPPSGIPLPPDGAPDILNHIVENGGIISKGDAKQGAEGYDVFEQLQLPGVYKRIMGGTETPDQMASYLLDHHAIGDGTINTMWNLIEAAIKRRPQLAADIKSETENQKAAEKAANATQTSQSVHPVSTATIEKPGATVAPTEKPLRESTALPNREAVDKIVAHAEAKAVAAEKNTKTDAAQGRIYNAKASAIMDAIGDDPNGIHREIDEHGNTRIIGNFDIANPYHAALVDLAGGISEKANENTQALQGIRGDVSHIRYRSAKSQTEGTPWKRVGMTERKGEYAEDPAAEREEGTIQHKAVIPIQTVFKGGRPMQSVFTLDNLLHNAESLKNFMKSKGMEFPYQDEQTLISDAQTYADNHQHGWTGDGSTPMKGFPDSGLPTPDLNYKAETIPKERFDVLNMLMHSEDAGKYAARIEEVQKKQQSVSEAKNDKERARLHGVLERAVGRMKDSEEAVNLARENNPWVDENTGESNELRAKLKAEGFVTQDAFKSPFETLDPQHILEMNAEPIAMQEGDIQTVRPTGFETGAENLAPMAKLNPKAVAARFMPDSGQGEGSKSELHRENDPITGIPTLITGPAVSRETSIALADRLEGTWNSRIKGRTATSSLSDVQIPGRRSGNDEVEIMEQRIPGATFGRAGASDGSGQGLVPFKSGGEATVYRSPEGAIYKVFRSKPDGGVGFRKVVEISDGGTVTSETRTGSLDSVIDKLRVLARVGGIPSEIHGITEDGDLVVKQPRGLAQEEDKIEDSDMLAARSKSLIQPIPKEASSNLHDSGFVTVVDGVPYLISDIAHRNVMRDNSVRPRLIDIDASPLPENVVKQLPKLRAIITKLKAAERIRDRSDVSFLPDTGNEKQNVKPDSIKILGKNIRTKNGSRYYNLVWRGDWFKIRLADHPQTSSDGREMDRIFRDSYSKQSGTGMQSPHELNVVLNKPVKTEDEARSLIKKVLQGLPSEAMERDTIYAGESDEYTSGNDDVYVDYTGEKPTYDYTPNADGVGRKYNQPSNPDIRLMPDTGNENLTTQEKAKRRIAARDNEIAQAKGKTIDIGEDAPKATVFQDKGRAGDNWFVEDHNGNVGKTPFANQQAAQDHADKLNGSAARFMPSEGQKPSSLFQTMNTGSTQERARARIAARAAAQPKKKRELETAQ